MKWNKKEIIVFLMGIVLVFCVFVFPDYKEQLLAILILLLIVYAIYNSKIQREYLAWELEKLNNKLVNDKKEAEGDLLTSFNQMGSLLNIHKYLPELSNLPSTRDWAASPDVLQLIIQEFIKSKPQNIIECGSGVSTLIFASLMKKMGINGKIISLDHDTFYANKTRERLLENGLQDYVTILDAPLIEYSIHDIKYKWYDLKNLPQDLKFDLAFIDGPPMNTNKLARFPFFDLIKSSLNTKYTLIVDDAKRLDEIEMVKLWNLSEASLKVENAFCEKGALIVRNF